MKEKTILRRESMKQWRAAIILTIFVSATGLSALQEPEVVVSERKISLNLESVTLGRLLRLWDQATGMRSSVPPELANRIVTVRFSELPLSDAVRKIFENQELDYVFIESQGIIVTTASETAPTGEPVPLNDGDLPVTAEASVNEPARSVQAPPPRQPPLVWTPFGFVVSGGNQFTHLPPIPGEAPTPAFFGPVQPLIPPAGSPNGPVQNNLFAPISIYQDPASLPNLRP
jgi:hypothetical protein